MLKRFLIFFMKIFFILINSKLKGTLSIELCEVYGRNNSLISSFYCLEYCCGTCNFNYCCRNESYSIDPEYCRNSTKQLSFRTTSTIKPKPTIKPIVYNEACGPYTNVYGTVIQPQRCSGDQRYCCGDCNKRHCCNSTINRLNQYNCRMIKESAATSPKKFNSQTYLYVILSLGGVLMLGLLCVPFIIFINRRRLSKMDRNIMQFRNLTPVNYIQQDIPMQVYEEPKVILHEDNQPPPAYSSLKFF